MFIWFEPAAFVPCRLELCKQPAFLFTGRNTQAYIQFFFGKRMEMLSDLNNAFARLVQQI